MFDKPTKCCEAGGMGGGFCVEISLRFDYDCGKEIFMEGLMLQHKLEKSASA